MSPAPSRRTLLSGAAALFAPTVAAAAAPAVRSLRHVDFNRYGDASAATPNAIASTSPDAGLIAMCDEFVTLDARLGEIGGLEETLGSDATDALAYPVSARQRELAALIYDTRATTLEGHQARARALLSWAPEWGDRDWFHDGPTGENLLASLLRDLAGVAWTTRTTQPHLAGADAIPPPGGWITATGACRNVSTTLIHRRR